MIRAPKIKPMTQLLEQQLHQLETKYVRHNEEGKKQRDCKESARL